MYARTAQGAIGRGYPDFMDTPCDHTEVLPSAFAMNAFVIFTTVLIRQNRISNLASQHSHLDLQVNLLAEQKQDRLDPGRTAA